jgi:hypothetical protein
MRFAGRTFAGPPLKGLGLNVTNIGPLRIKWPIVDAWASIRIAESFASGSLSITAFSVTGKRRNDLAMRLRYGDGVFGDDEAATMAKSIGHFVRHIRLDRNVQSALDELREIQAGNFGILGPRETGRDES